MTGLLEGKAPTVPVQLVDLELLAGAMHEALGLGLMHAIESTEQGTGWHAGVRTVPLVIEPGRWALEGRRLEHIEALLVTVPDRRLFAAGDVKLAFVSDVAPGGFLKPHRDAVPPEGRRRFHVPLRTNERALFTIDTPAGDNGAETWHMALGAAYEIDASAWHSVVNRGDTHRTHLVIDVARADAT